MELELVAEDLAFPEGPVAMADGSVVLTEIVTGVVTRIAPDGSRSTVAKTGGGPNGLAIGPDGALYCCNNGGRFAYTQVQGLWIPGDTPPEHTGGSIQRIDIATGRVETVYEACDGRPILAPNDLVFDAHGGFWFSDHGTSDAEGRRHGALLYARADGSAITRARHGLYTPNGVGLSPDEGVVYMADTMSGRLWAFDVAGPGCAEAARAVDGAGPRGGDAARLPTFRQPRRGGGRARVRGHHHQWRDQRGDAGGRGRALRRARPDHHQHRLRRPRHAHRLDHRQLDG